MSLFSISTKHHVVLDFLSLCLSIPLGQTQAEGLVCFWRARNHITSETTSVASDDSPAGCLIALTTGTDTEAASHSSVYAVVTFPLGLETVPALPHEVFIMHLWLLPKNSIFKSHSGQSMNRNISSTSICK